MTRSRPLLLIVLALVATASLWRHPGFLAAGYDWRYFESAMEAARRNLVWFHQLPLYDPWMCGGEVQLANPQSVAGSPAFVLIALFGTALGAKLMLVVFVALGLDGAYRLARHHGLSSTGALGCAFSFGLSGWIVAHFAVGHVSFFGAALLPHLLYFYRRALHDLRWSLPAGATAAVIVAQGGTSTAVMAGLGLASVFVLDCVALRSMRPLVVVLASAGAALALGAYRVLPALEFALDHPRHTHETDGLALVDLVLAGFTREVSGRWRGLHYGLHEYAWRVPFLAWPLAIAGAVALARRRLPTQRLGLAVLALSLVGLGVALGDSLPYGPWWVMKHLPVLRDLRAPSRYVLLLGLGVSLLAGAGIDALRVRLSPRSIAWASSSVLVLLALDGVIFANRAFDPVFAWPSPRMSHAAFFQVQGHYTQMLPLLYDNRGVVGCDEEAPLTRAQSLDLGDVAQARLLDPDAGRIEALRWTPNGFDVNVALTRATTLLLDTNWNEHFTTSVGTVKRWGPKWPADKDGGRLSVELPAMSGAVTVRYLPTSFRVGLVVSLIAALLALALVIGRGRQTTPA